MEKTSHRQRWWEWLGWSRDSSVLLGGFLLTCGLIVYVWWPLAEELLATIDWQGQWWRYFDWLLVGVFAFMSLTIVSHANLRRDALIVFVGFCGGLVIESWGTQTNLWFYYTAERPPLWIIPAWPIASLSIERVTRAMLAASQRLDKVGTGKERLERFFNWAYWAIFGMFMVLMVLFVRPTLDKSFTITALLLCTAFILTPNDHRYAVLTFLAGAGLGYFLELWGTTRECWTYYTLAKPPFFAVLAHGMAAVAFWRGGLLVQLMWKTLHRLAAPQRESKEKTL